MCCAIAVADPTSPCVTKTRRVGVRGEAANSFGVAAHRNPLSKHLNFSLTVRDATPQRCRCLVTNENNRGILVRQYSQSMMKYATSSHHSRSTDNHARTAFLV